MSESKPNVPKLRFPGFTEPWEQRRLGDVGSIHTGNTPSTSNPDYYSENGIPWITPTDIDESDVKTTEKCLSPEGAKVARLVPAGSILCTCIASIGKNALTKTTCGFNQQINALVPNPGQSDSAFLFAQSALWSKRMKLMAASSAMQIVNKTEFSKLPCMLPSLPEQRFIGTLFRNLDGLIALRQRELDHVKLLKRGLLQKMFPKDGAGVPEIRFPGFTDPWEQRKAQEVFGFRDERNRAELPVLSATQENGMVFRDDSMRVVGHDVSNEVGYKRVAPGDFVIHLRSFQGGFAHSSIEGIASPAYTVLLIREPDKHCDLFWKCCFSSERFVRSLTTVTYGIRDGRSINVEEFMNMNLRVPSLPEQRLIGAFFRDIDDLIALHQRELDHLKLQKKALLQQMFV